MTSQRTPSGMDVVSVRLRFKSEYAKDFFMGQLSDGWGEDHCNLSPVDGQHYVGDVYDVEVWSDWGGETHEVEDESTDRQAQRMKELYK